MSAILDFPGFFAALVLALVIVVPVLIRALREQKQQQESDPIQHPVSTAAPPVTVVECSGCGQANRVPLEVERALCGGCKAELPLSSQTRSLEASGASSAGEK